MTETAPASLATAATPPSCQQFLYLSRDDVERVALPFEEVVDAVDRVLHEKGCGLVESPPKRGVVPRPGASIRAMKAHVPSLGTAGVKWISAFPDNTEVGLPTISGLLVLNEVETGLPIAVMDCTWLTAVRTAACTVVAARRLARPDSTTAGIVACGLQGRVNLRALARDFALTDVKAYDVRPAAARAFAAEMSDELGVSVEVVSTVEAAVRERDLVVTSCPIVKDPTPTIRPGWLAPGSFAALLDFDTSIHGDALRALDRFYTDDLRQVAFFQEIGYLRDVPEPDGDLGKLVAGRIAGRRTSDETLATMNLGIGALDVAVGTRLFERASDLGLGASLPL